MEKQNARFCNFTVVVFAYAADVRKEIKKSKQRELH